MLASSFCSSSSRKARKSRLHFHDDVHSALCNSPEHSEMWKSKLKKVNVSFRLWFPIFNGITCTLTQACIIVLPMNMKMWKKSKLTALITSGYAIFLCQIRFWCPTLDSLYWIHLKWNPILQAWKTTCVTLCLLLRVLKSQVYMRLGDPVSQISTWLHRFWWLSCAVGTQKLSLIWLFIERLCGRKSYSIQSLALCRYRSLSEALFN